MGNSTHDNFELLQKYLDGDLTEEERSRIEDAIANDPGLKREWEIVLLARHAIRENAIRERVAAIGKTFTAIDEKPVGGMPLRRVVIRFSLAIAAAIVLFVVGFYGFLAITVSPEKLYSGYYHPYELNTLRATYPSDTSAVVRAYRNLDYSKIIGLVQAQSTSTRLENFLCGIAFLETGEPSKAVMQFRIALSADKVGGGLMVTKAADYYLGLAYLRMKDYDHALEVFESIAGDDAHPYNEKTDRALLRKIRVLRWRN